MENQNTAIRRTFSLGDRSLSWVFSIYVVDVLLFGIGSLAVALSPRFEAQPWG